jgi:hypothetical protein
VYRNVHLFILLFAFVSAADAVIETFARLHYKKKNQILLLGDIHNSYYDAELAAPEAEQIAVIIPFIRNYKEKYPLDVYIEARTYASATFGVGPKSIMDLYETLEDCRRKKGCCIIDFDIRNYLALARTFFRGDRRYEEKVFIGPGSTPKTDMDLATFDHVFDEINAYYDSISKACLRLYELYFSTPYETSLAHRYLAQANQLSKDLETYLREQNIPLDDCLRDVSNSLVGDCDKLPIRNHIHEVFSEIGCYLTDVALYIKVILSYRDAHQVIVFGGCRHVQHLFDLLKDQGFCDGGSPLPTQYLEPLNAGLLTHVLNTKQDECPISIRCPILKIPSSQRLFS